MKKKKVVLMIEKTKRNKLLTFDSKIVFLG